MAIVSYLAPTNIADAFEYLGATGARIIGGCTDHFPGRTADRIAEPLLDVTRLDGFRGVSETADGWRIGAATTWTDIIKAPLPKAFDGLKLAAREVGSVQIQNRGTVAGNICNASPAADGVPPLLTLGARVEVVSAAGSRQVDLGDFITGVRKTALQPGELVSAILIPSQPKGMRSDFLKLGSRTHLVISIAMVAVCVELDDDRLTEARLAVGSCAPVAPRLKELERALIGMTAADVAALDFAALDVWAPLNPINDVRGTADYRLDAVATLCRRAVLRAMG